MNPDNFYPSKYGGTKSFTQADVRTANATGFGAAADDYMERGIDLNEELIGNKPATFFMRVSSDAMKDAGILTVEEHAAGGRLVEPQQQPRQGRLP